MQDILSREQVLPLLELLPDWGDFTTIVFSAGCVFEFKGPFPRGQADGEYYNLGESVPGLHGHLRLAALDHVRFQDRPHRGRDSYAFVFETAEGKTVFKVFLGRDGEGRIHPSQLSGFHRIRDALSVTAA